MAIARALANRPKILLADEPTGNLDRQTGQQVMRLIKDMQQAHNVAVVMVTHDESAALEADRVFVLNDGILELSPNKYMEDVNNFISHS